MKIRSSHICVKLAFEPLPSVSVVSSVISNGSFGAAFAKPVFLALLILLLAVAAPGQSFTVAANPTSLTLHPGDQNVPVTIAIGSSTYSGPINITFTGLPSGIAVTPLTLTPGGTGTVFLSAALNADQEAFPATGATNPDSDSTSVTVVGAVGQVRQTSNFTLIVSLSNPSFMPTHLDLPRLDIDTSGTPIVDKDTDIAGTVTITAPNGTVILPSTTNADNTAAFHLHGNSTQYMPKKPYHVKFTTSLDLLTVMGLTCPYKTSKGAAVCDKSKSYILLANYDDKTLLRDWAASALANSIPIGGNYLSEVATTGKTPPSPSGTSTVMPWAPHSLFVELYLNGEYEGNYQLIEQLKLDSHRVNIASLAESDVSDTATTGGYLVEIDHRQDQAFVWQTPQGLKLGLDDPDFTPDAEIPQQTSYIQGYVAQAENALFSSNFTDPATGWRNYFDEASAINYYIAEDVMGNADGGDFYSSDYFYKDRGNQYIYMGPVWDFDISSGNVYYNPIYNPTVPWMQKDAKWYAQWFLDPVFKAHVVKQWNQLKADGVFTSWIGSINAQAAALQQSQANNFSRWPMLGEKVWPNPQAAGSYDGEVSYFTNWLTLRIAYLDSILNGKTGTKSTLTVAPGTLRQGVPAQLQAATTLAGAGTGTPTGVVTFLSNGLVLGQATLDGTGAASGSFNLPAGSNAITAVYNGDPTFALSSSTPKSVTVLSPLVSTTTSLSASVGTANLGASVSFPITVIPQSGATSPTGIVSLQLNGNPFGTISLTGGSATFSSNSLLVGPNMIQAVYGGDPTYTASSSSTVSVTVSQFCSAPSSPGVVVCSPLNNSTVTSPVQVAASATITGTLARMEVWVDGVKKYSETTSKTLSTSISVGIGKHRFDFYAVNSSGQKWLVSTSATVPSNLTAPVITWANPAPIAYGTQLSAFQLNATADVAGTFVYNPGAGALLSIGQQTLTTTFTPTDAAHYSSATKSVTISVNGGPCNPPGSSGVTVCSPINNSAVSSPVSVQAAAKITGTLARMEVWVDGVKKYSESSSTLFNTTVPLAIGKHRFDIYAVNTTGTKWESTTYATVR